VGFGVGVHNLLGGKRGCRSEVGSLDFVHSKPH
jgi:hypothetical protein